MKPKLGQTYSRREISAMLGGPIQAFLPYRNGQVVCGCFNTSKSLNPGAPEEVLFGSDEGLPIVEKTAQIVYQQGTPVPVFLFREDAQWEYVGDYRCVALLRDSKLLEQRMRTYPQRGTITGVLQFEKAA